MLPLLVIFSELLPVLADSAASVTDYLAAVFCSVVNEGPAGRARVGKAPSSPRRSRCQVLPEIH